MRPCHKRTLCPKSARAEPGALTRFRNFLKKYFYGSPGSSTLLENAGFPLRCLFENERDVVRRDIVSAFIISTINDDGALQCQSCCAVLPVSVKYRASKIKKNLAERAFAGTGMQIRTEKDRGQGGKSSPLLTRRDEELGGA